MRVAVALRVAVVPFFFNDTATTEIYTLARHDALPIFVDVAELDERGAQSPAGVLLLLASLIELMDVDEVLFYEKLDRKSTRLNSSHANISYAVFCLKKKQRPDAPAA